MKLSIIIPCYNEEYTIKPLLKKIFKVKFPIEREIIVVDDGSEKNHREIIKEEIDAQKIRFIRLPKNQGKGMATRVGLNHAKGNIFIVQDADFEYFPADIPKLIRPIINKEINVVYGSRFSSFSGKMTKAHFLGNIVLTKITNFLFKVKLTDMETGYKVFTRTVYDKINLFAREFEFEPEITSKIILSGFKIKEIPIQYKYRNYGTSKISFLDGIEGVFILFQQRFCPNSKIYQYLYYIFKFHLKKVFKRLIKIPLFFIHKRL